MENFAGLVQRRFWLLPLVGLLLLVVGFAIGLPVGWMTVDFKPGTDDIITVADAYAINNDQALAKRMLKNLTPDELTTKLNALIQDRTKNGKTIEAGRLSTLAPVVGVKVGGSVGATTPVAGTTVVPGTPAPTSAPGGGTSAASSGPNPLVTVALIAVVILLLAAAAAIFLLRILPKMRAKQAAGGSTAAMPTLATPTPPAGTRPISPTPTAPAATTTSGGLGRFVPAYTLGNDNYDTSYSLETGRGEFLGECGMGISETIGEGKPDKVAAFDLWLFDKADVRTVTQILMSDYAFKDQTLRTKLATKGEAILAEKGKTLRLETASIHLEAQIVEMVYATNPAFPPNSHFQKLIVEIVPVLREGAPAPVAR